MLLVLFSLTGCELYEWVTGTVRDSVADHGIQAIDQARTLVRDAEDSPGRRRVLRVLRRLESDIDAGELSGINGNVFAAAVEEVAKDGAITSTEAGMVEDAFQRFLDGDLSRRRGEGQGRHGSRGAAEEASDDAPVPDVTHD